MDELFAPADQAPRRVSLTRLAGEVARALSGIGRISVEGEVHRPNRHPGGVYFTLRDRTSQLSVRCPSNRLQRCRTVAGERVLVTGTLQFANDRGQLLLIADEVSPVGAGAVAAAIADARRRLAEEGLIDRPRRAVPLLPRVIGVVCGSEAAVRRDIESVVAARFPGYPVVFDEVTVSGPGAVDALTAALARLDAREEIEVIVLARGGGDATQLLPFSDEGLCRAIVAASTPVVSAIGHDGDRPLCDDVADLRCGTPSMAAAAVVPDRAALLATLDRHRVATDLRWERAVAASVARLQRAAPAGALAAAVHVAARRLHGAGGSVAMAHPSRLMGTARARLEGCRRELDALDPRRVLERGYAVVRGPTGAVVRVAGQLSTGDRVHITLAAGRAQADVVSVAT